MENILIILNSEDIPAASTIASNLPDYKTYVFDPQLLDKIKSAELKNCQLIISSKHASFESLDSIARASADAIEIELALVGSSIIPSTSIHSWQHLNFYHTFLMLQWYDQIWTSVGEQLRGGKIYVFVCDSPLSYHFNSFVPSTQLLNFLVKNNIVFSGFSYGGKLSDSHQVLGLHGVRDATNSETVLTHLPTCFYDYSYYNNELLASGKHILNLGAKFFNVPVWSHESFATADYKQMLQEVSEDWRNSLARFKKSILEKTESLLRSHMAIEHYRIRQAEYISEVYTSQMLSFALLLKFFSKEAPSKLILSDHDADFHGPLISFAKLNDLPVLMLPHSKTTSDIPYNYKKITCLTHPIQGEVILHPDATKVFHHNLSFPTSFSLKIGKPTVIRKISLLLQAISADGIYCTDYSAYMLGIRKIASWCRQKNIELSVRAKPNYTFLETLSEELELESSVLRAISNIPMESYVQDIDLCIMYDSPTSAELHFLNDGIATLHATLRPLSNTESMVSTSKVIPRLSIEECLRLTSHFVRSPDEIDQFRKTQFCNYIKCFKESRALRDFI